MMTKKKFSLKKLTRSFAHAFNGLLILLKEEPNARIHAMALTMVVVLGIVFNLTRSEWFVIAILVGFVISMELLNSAIENLSDLVSPEQNEYIKKAKDQGAAAVLVAAIVSLIIGMWIFIPHILEVISN